MVHSNNAARRIVKILSSKKNVKSKPSRQLWSFTVGPEESSEQKEISELFILAIADLLMMA